MKKPADKQKEVTAATFKRLAKALRVRARNHSKSSKDALKRGWRVMSGHEATLTVAFDSIAYDLDNEANALRGMR